MLSSSLCGLFSLSRSIGNKQNATEKTIGKCCFATLKKSKASIWIQEITVESGREAQIHVFMPALYQQTAFLLFSWLLVENGADALEKTQFLWKLW